MKNGHAKQIKHIADLRPLPSNPNIHTPRGAALVENSLRECGYADSMTVDRNGVIISGHQRIDSLSDLGFGPPIVVQSDGRHPVIHQRTDLDADSPVARKLAVLMNRRAELDLNWSPEILKEYGQDLDLGKLGFTDQELADILGEEQPQVDEGAAPQIDKATELQKKWETTRGQVWKIGKHRLMCGDCTKDENVAALMQDRKAELINTDPPYGVDYASTKDGIPRSGFEHIKAEKGNIENDDLVDGTKLQAFLESAIRAALPRLIENPAFYLWHPMLTQGTFFAAAAAADILIHRQIIWVKPGFVLTRSGMYHWKHELCFYGWIRGKPCNWYGDKSQVSVWECGRDDTTGLHHTQKPVELFARPIMNHTRKGEVCYEPFAGSGSQFIAAEQLNCIGYGMEISPAYCAVVLQRMVDAFKLTPELVS